MILMAGAAVVAGVFVHRVGYWDGWHKGVARGRELARLEAQNDRDDPTFPRCLTDQWKSA